MSALPEAEKINGLITMLKEKALKKDNYFLEYIISELGRIPSAKDAVYTEIEGIKAIVGGLPVSTSGVTVTTAAISTEVERKKVLGWLYLVSAQLKDERVLSDLEKGLKEPELYYICMRAMAALNRDLVISMLLNEPEGSEKASVLLKILTTGVPEVTGGDFMPPANWNVGSLDDALMEKLESLLISEKSKERYLDAGFIFAAIDNYDKALVYLGLFDSADDKKSYTSKRDLLLSECLLNNGKFAESRELNPLLDDKAQRMYFPLMSGISSNIQEMKGNVQGQLSLIAGFCMETGRYKNALDILKSINEIKDRSAGLREKTGKLIRKCEKEIKTKLDKYLNQTAVLKEDKLKLELIPGKTVYKAGEEVKIELKVTNTLTGPMYFLNDTEGIRGLDAGIFKDGLLVKRIKTLREMSLPPSELVGKLFVVKPGEAFETSLVLLSGNENAEGEYNILVSYDGGEPFLGFEKGWIKSVLLSDRIKIKTEK